MEFLAKHWGDLAGALGFAFTIWLAFQAKTAAEQARDAAQEAAQQVRERISALDTIGDLSTAIAILQEIIRLQRTNAWDIVWNIVLDRYTTVRPHLVRCEQGVRISETYQDSIRTVLAQLVIIVKEIESARTTPKQKKLDTVSFNRVISDQIDALEKVRVGVKKAEA